MILCPQMEALRNTTAAEMRCLVIVWDGVLLFLFYADMEIGG